MDPKKKAAIYPGQEVNIISSYDSSSSKVSRGFVHKILSENDEEPRGIKVKLKSGEEGHVQEIISEREDQEI